MVPVDLSQARDAILYLEDVGAESGGSGNDTPVEINLTNYPLESGFTFRMVFHNYRGVRLRDDQHGGACEFYYDYNDVPGRMDDVLDITIYTAGWRQYDVILTLVYDAVIQDHYWYVRSLTACFQDGTDDSEEVPM